MRARSAATSIRKGLEAVPSPCRVEAASTVTVATADVMPSKVTVKYHIPAGVAGIPVRVVIVTVAELPDTSVNELTTSGPNVCGSPAAFVHVIAPVCPLAIWAVVTANVAEFTEPAVNVPFCAPTCTVLAGTASCVIATLTGGNPVAVTVSSAGRGSVAVFSSAVALTVTAPFPEVGSIVSHVGCPVIVHSTLEAMLKDLVSPSALKTNASTEILSSGSGVAGSSLHEENRKTESRRQKKAPLNPPRWGEIAASLRVRLACLVFTFTLVILKKDLNYY